MATLVIGVVLDGGGEEGIDEGSLSQTRFASDLDDIRYILKFKNHLLIDSKSKCGTLPVVWPHPIGKISGVVKIINSYLFDEAQKSSEISSPPELIPLPGLIP